MLLKKNDLPGPDFLENWPAHYYEIKDILQRKEFLEKAISLHLDPDHDCFRMQLLKKRFFARNKKGTADSFILAWIMIKASAASADSLFVKKQKQELENNLKSLCLYDYPSGDEAYQQVLREEWSDFARRYLASCAESKNYCSTLFNMVPLKEEALARKLTSEIDLITRIYPSSFGFEDLLLPLRQIMVDTFCQMIQNGESYWNHSL